jgi:spore germination cell wall hydrolase CwlJ-like protein
MLTASAQWRPFRLALPTRQQWASSAVLATMVLLYVVAGFSLGLRGGDARAFIGAVPAGWSGAQTSIVPREAPPVPEPLAFRDMAPLDAVALNASIPLSGEPNPAARPFAFGRASEIDRVRSLDCLTAAVYYEAAIESEDGQRAVAQVVLNRLRHPAFPKSVCGVVFQGSDRSTGCQFTFTCDGSLARIPYQQGWERARKVAEEALDGKVYKPVGYSTHYHTNWVVPYWSSSLTKVANVGTHIFYRWEGGWGRPAAFRYAYSGAEPALASMRQLSSEPIALADAVVGPDGLPIVAPANPAVTPDDVAGRAVMRRYEPLREQAAAATKSQLAKAEVPLSLRWSLTGDSGAPAAAPTAKSVSPVPFGPALPGASAATGGK